MFRFDRYCRAVSNKRVAGACRHMQSSSTRAVPAESGGTVKILFMAPFGIRPKGTVIARMLPLAVQLQSLGHHVTIVAPPYTNPEDSGLVEVVNGVTLRNIRLGPKNRVLATPLLAWRMFREILKEKPDLVHLFKPKGYGGLAAMLLVVLGSFGFRLPQLLVDTDDWEGRGGMNELHAYSSLEKLFYEFQESWLLRRATAVTVASRALQGLVQGEGLSDESILYLPNSVAAGKRGNGDRIRAQLGIESSSPVVLLYTRFFEFSQEKLHTIFDGIFKQVPAVRFLVVGRGRHNEEAGLLAVAREKGFDKALIMAGWVEPSSIPDYLAAGDLALYPFADTLVNRCKCPAKLTELLLAAVPVVADRVGQIQEYVSPAASEVLCDPDDWQQMTDRAVSLLKDNGKRQLIGEEGRRYLLDQFNWSAYAARLDIFYKEHVTI